ncbi:class I SAM-dependent methyltransferase [Candidatus Woesearchaeota archaeon]|nr:class I SAM-dependent methyltransferase [Candidatus Woesearchaeota archaeon]
MTVKTRVLSRFRQNKRIFSIFQSISFLRDKVIDPPNIRKTEWNSNIKSLKIKRHLTIFNDRELEFKNYFRINNLFLFKYYLRNNFPRTMIFADKITKYYQDSVDNDIDLNNAHKNSEFDYLLRLMMAYTRFTMILPYLDFIKNNNKISEMKILDYGCGVSDIGILFASLGADVTISEISGTRLDFAKKRYDNRGFKVTCIPINGPSHYPVLEENKYDLIIATELFEHVRDPFKLLKNFTNALKIGGYLFDSMGGNFDRPIKGDHLKESIQIGNSIDYINFYKYHFDQLNVINNHPNLLYLKKR